MSYTNNEQKLPNESSLELQETYRIEDEGKKDKILSCERIKSSTYAVTVSKKPSASSEEDSQLCTGQKSFISIHSTDHPCQSDDLQSLTNLDDCNVEVLTLNDVFPSTSDESLSNDDLPVTKRRRNSKKKEAMQKPQSDDVSKSPYMPTNSKSATVSGRQRNPGEGQASGFSDYDIPKSTLYVTGSNPGEPKMSYSDTPKKISKTMKKFLRNIEKHKNDLSSKTNEKISNLATMRGILKDGRCGAECTGDSSLHEEQFAQQEDSFRLPFPNDFVPQVSYTKQGPDKNVTFNTQVVIIHFTGNLCVGQSVEALSKEKDQQARNSELRKTFLTKFNENWPTQK